MTDDPQLKAKRSKLLGRILIIALGLLLLAQMVPFFLQSLR